MDIPNPPWTESPGSSLYRLKFIYSVDLEFNLIYRTFLHLLLETVHLIV